MQEIITQLGHFGASMDKPKDLFIKNVKRQMATLGINQIELSARLKIKPSGVNKYLSGISSPGLKVIFGWAKALETTPAALLSQEGEANIQVREPTKEEMLEYISKAMGTPAQIHKIPKNIIDLLSQATLDVQWEAIYVLVKPIVDARHADQVLARYGDIMDEEDEEGEGDGTDG